VWNNACGWRWKACASPESTSIFEIHQHGLQNLGILIRNVRAFIGFGARARNSEAGPCSGASSVTGYSQKQEPRQMEVHFTPDGQAKLDRLGE